MNLSNCGQVPKHAGYFFYNKNSALPENSYEEQTVEWYPYKRAPHPKHDRRPVANFNDFQSFKKVT